MDVLRQQRSSAEKVEILDFPNVSALLTSSWGGGDPWKCLFDWTSEILKAAVSRRKKTQVKPGSEVLFFHPGTPAGGFNADVHHVNRTALEINNSINYRGDESAGAAPIFMMTPRENSLR